MCACVCVCVFESMSEKLRCMCFFRLAPDPYDVGWFTV